MKPVCVPCQRFFRPHETGFYFIEAMPCAGALPGTSEPEKWVPYKLWVGDKWKCEGCGAEIISGVGREPISEHYKPNFKELVVMLGAELRINDC